MSSRMKILAVSTAIVAAGGLAWLTSALAFDGGFERAPQVAQAAPPATTPPVAGGGAANGQMRPQRPAFNPRNMCFERTARKVGMRAYLKARLDLKPEQMAAWNTFEKASDDVTAKDKTRCATLPTEIKERPKFADRMNMREKMMKTRYDNLEAVKPSLMALYAALTPEQQAIFDRPPMGGHGGPRHHGWRGRG
jgi:LTXXQ motif family protein